MRLNVLIIAYMLSALSAVAQENTTPTLRLADVFDIKPDWRSGYVSSGGEYDRSGPVLLVPDTAAWRLPSGPPPSRQNQPKAPELSGLARLPMLMPGAVFDRSEIDRPAFEFRGVTLKVDSAELAQVRIATPYNLLRCEYEIRRRHSETGAPEIIYTFFHGPGTEEQFLIPAGEYWLERRIWRPDIGDAVIEESYTRQNIVPRGIYEFLGGTKPEPDILRDLRERAEKGKK